ncbi:cotton fiber protein [Parasponia andersonii]|uniref:Cotton fiber protein n=1 Tax=Parasponia andersonii TaxID=3476 RepID=A0A2P5CKV0_PARAD|nr:cotton fiber protein [Parasponia andersonii]
MPKQNNDVARRAWNTLRLALLWARKGGVFKRRLMTELRLLPKFVKSLGHNTPRRDRIRYYGERQLSFDKTPIFPALKVNGSSSMRYFHIPCLNPPPVDFDYEFCDGQDDDVYGGAYDKRERGRKSFLINGGDCVDQEDDHDDHDYEEENIDTRADEFIAQFYEQIKMQRQISYLQYNETPKRSTC